MATAPGEEWSTCRYCGDAVPPSATSCPTCGERERLVQDREIPHLPGRARYRVRLMQGVRIALVVAVIVGILYAVTAAVLTGPPVVPDPLTTQGVLTVGPGNFTYLFGAVTGEDYIDGNFTVVYPVGVPINFAVYNSTEFAAFAQHQSATTIAGSPQESSARILFAAPYTDTFYLVFQNPYPPSSGILVHIYEVTNYQTNVVLG